jgi:DUF2993 family protein
VPLVVLALLVAADRVAAAAAERTIATRTERYGFIGKPAVRVEGFPFLTQLRAGRLDRVDISGGRLRLGLATAGGAVTAENVSAVAAGITLGQRGDVISRLTGSGLIPFAAVDRLAQAARIPGARVSAAGPHLLRVQASFGFITAAGTASVAVSGPSTLRVRLVSAPGVPSFLIDRIRAFTIQLPALPLGVALRSVRVVPVGVVITVTGHDVPVPG